MSTRDWTSYCMCVWLTHMNRTQEPLTDSLGPHGTAITKSKIKSTMKKRFSTSVKSAKCNTKDDIWDGSIPPLLAAFLIGYCTTEMFMEMGPPGGMT